MLSTNNKKRKRRLNGITHLDMSMAYLSTSTDICLGGSIFFFGNGDVIFRLEYSTLYLLRQGPNVTFSAPKQSAWKVLLCVHYGCIATYPLLHVESMHC